MEKSNTTLQVAKNQPQKMYLPSVDRSIFDENTSALLRRWEIARTVKLSDPRIMNRWFPGQRELFKILSVLNEEQVVDLADCGLPLFNLRLPTVANDGVFFRKIPDNAFEAACLEEATMALVTRLDALRTSLTHACVVFDLNSSQANFISRHNPRELQAIASDPAVGLIPAISDEFFIHAAMSNLTFRERTVLAANTRCTRALAH